MITADTIREAFVLGLDSGASVRTRRPSLIQVELPAFRADGDAGEIYVRPATKGDSLVVTDLGTTRMRLGYVTKLTAEIDEQLSTLASGQGMDFTDGEIRVTVGKRDMLAAALGLLQVEAQAERLGVGRRAGGKGTAAFREQVSELLRTMFAGRIQEGYFDAATDPDGLFSVDALIDGARPLAVVVVPNDLEAERAIGTKANLRPQLAKTTRWVAIPRDIERLVSRTRRRLVRDYIQAGASFAEDRAIVEERLRDLVA